MIGRSMSLAAILACWAAAAGAEPALYRVASDRSAIAFVYALNGRPAEGAFRQMTGEGRFDPEAPETARLLLEIDVKSLDLGDLLATVFALSGDWFDADQHPVARYRLARLTALGGDAYEALGDLTIKGRTQVMRTPLTLTVGPDAARARGALTFDPRDFGVGVGPTALFVSVGTEVAVRFDLVAAPAR
jgi:polyisoprenoid-binding protein YceI